MGGGVLFGVTVAMHRRSDVVALDPHFEVAILDAALHEKGFASGFDLGEKRAARRPAGARVELRHETKQLRGESNPDAIGAFGDAVAIRGERVHSRLEALHDNSIGPEAKCFAFALAEDRHCVELEGDRAKCTLEQRARAMASVVEIENDVGVVGGNAGRCRETEVMELAA